MKLFYLMVSAVILTTNPLFAMDREDLTASATVPIIKPSVSKDFLEDEAINGIQATFLEVSVTQLKLCLKDSKNGIRGYGPGSVFVNSEVFQINMTDAARVVLRPAKGKKVQFWELSSAFSPNFENVLCDNIRVADAGTVVFQQRWHGEAYTYTAKLWGDREFRISLAPLKYSTLQH